jgi:hypothetical protein
VIIGEPGNERLRTENSGDKLICFGTIISDLELGSNQTSGQTKLSHSQCARV